MRDYLKGLALTFVLFAALGAATLATSRPGETVSYARAAARGLCAVPAPYDMAAAACRRLARLRPHILGRRVLRS